VIDRIESLRRQRLPGNELATTVGVSPATVSRVLKRLGLSKLSALEPAEPPRRYERQQPGEMIHIDIKKLGKFNQIGHRITGDPRVERLLATFSSWPWQPSMRIRLTLASGRPA
jgi:hypothetical protein